MAHGSAEITMSAGGELDYLDEGTLSHAFKARRSL
jgi:recombinational DNA repair protein RecR